jgi:chorismate synthase
MFCEHALHVVELGSGMDARASLKRDLVLDGLVRRRLIMQKMDREIDRARLQSGITQDGVPQLEHLGAPTGVI